MSDAVESRDVALTVNSLTKKGQENIYGYNGLEEISFSFEKKGIHGILAPKGSGKTQLMNIISGCETYDDGAVLLFNTPVSVSDYEVKKRIGYVQKNNVFYPNMTAMEIMSFVGDSRRVEQGKLYRQVKEAMELTGIDGIKNRLVKNMTEYEQKKLSLAAALLGNPDIILLDELVTPKMNDGQLSALFGLIQMLGKMKTVILSTDSYKIAKELCEDVVIISDGKVLAKGRFDILEDKLKGSEDTASLEALYNSLAAASEIKHSKAKGE